VGRLHDCLAAALQVRRSFGDIPRRETDRRRRKTNHGVGGGGGGGKSKSCCSMALHMAAPAKLLSHPPSSITVVFRCGGFVPASFWIWQARSSHFPARREGRNYCESNDFPLLPQRYDILDKTYFLASYFADGYEGSKKSCDITLAKKVCLSILSRLNI
jgi:hypothetical protein